MIKIVYATTNPGKFAEVQKIFASHGINICSAADYHIDIDVDETGTTLEENAVLKAETYLKAINADDIVVVSDDTGLEIDALGGEPGIKVRRWKGYKMSDDEILSYTLERLSGIPKEERTASFRTVIAVASLSTPTRTFEGRLAGLIVEEPASYREEGLPFQPLFYSTEFKQMLYQIHTLSTAEKLAKHIVTHRERAVIAALPYIATFHH